MADNFGLKIGIEGEKEFKNALRDINQSFKVRFGNEIGFKRIDKQTTIEPPLLERSSTIHCAQR